MTLKNTFFKTAFLVFIAMFLTNFANANTQIIANSGIFMGFSGGGIITAPDYGNTTYSTIFPTAKPKDTAKFSLKDLNPQLEFGWAVGAKLGYRTFLGQNWGIKTYIDYYYSRSNATKRYNGYSQTKNYPVETTYKIARESHLAAINLDLFYRRDRLGASMGVGLGYQKYKFDSSTSIKYNGSYPQGLLAKYSTAAEGKESFASVLAMPLNVALTYDLTTNDQLSINAKIPLLNYSYSYSDPSFEGTISLKNYLVFVEYSYTFQNLDSKNP